MRAIAWDDEPKGYMADLKRHLKEYGIDVRIEVDPDEFIRRFFGEQWDLVITDLVRDVRSPAGMNDVSVGVQIARRISGQVPVVMITKHYEVVDRDEFGLPEGVILKSKSTHPGWLAAEIYNELIRRGQYFNASRVFLIYGHDRGADGATRRVEHLLQRKKIEVARISGVNLTTEIGRGLLEQMNNCAAFIAICTPDDSVGGEGRWQPRQNVLLEIGMAMGIARGLHRLTILQKWGPSREEQAMLPSDLSGVLTVRFEGGIEAVFAELLARLRSLRVQIDDLEV